MASGARRILTGSFRGTGAQLDIKTIGFRPSLVKLYNITGNCQAVWLAGMADASMQKTVDSGAGTTDMSAPTSGGITPLADGFRLGADADLNVSGEVVHYEVAD